MSPKATAPGRAGRPSKIEKVSEQDLVRMEELLRAGNFVEPVASVLGIDRATFYVWLKRGKRAREGNPFRRFHDRVMRACDEAEQILVTAVAAKALEDPRAGLELLARRFPERWSPRQRVDLGMDAVSKGEAVIKVKLKLGGTE